MKNLGIGVRLGIGFAVVWLLCALMTVFGLLRLQQVAEYTNATMQQTLIKERLVSDWYRLTRLSLVRTSAIARSDDPSLDSTFAADNRVDEARIAALADTVRPMLNAAAEAAAIQKILTAREQYNGAVRNIMTLKREGRTSAARHVLDSEIQPADAAYRTELRKLLDIQRRSIDGTVQEINRIYVTARNSLIVLGGVVLAIGVAFSVWLTAGITRPLRRAVALACTVASGDLTSHIGDTSGDETGQLLRALGDMNANLLRIVRQVRACTESIVSGTSQIATGNTDLSQRTEEQATSLQQTASSMEQLTGMVRLNADNARQASALAVDASDIAGQGGEVGAKVAQTMEEINKASKKVADIIAVIDGIAFQTNILAINAAVEAARAGEQGRGFAVVAAEVRGLAQRSATAAKEIKALIEASVDRVEKGTVLVSQSSQSLEGILVAVGRVTGIMGEISTASAEQSEGIEQVNQALAQMDTVTQQNAALVEEAAAAAGSLEEQALWLRDTVSTFRLDADDSLDSQAKESDRHAAPDVSGGLPRKGAAERFAEVSSRALSIQPGRRHGSV